MSCVHLHVYVIIYQRKDATCMKLLITRRTYTSMYVIHSRWPSPAQFPSNANQLIADINRSLQLAVPRLFTLHVGPQRLALSPSSSDCTIVSGNGLVSRWMSTWLWRTAFGGARRADCYTRPLQPWPGETEDAALHRGVRGLPSLLQHRAEGVHVSQRSGWDTGVHVPG